MARSSSRRCAAAASMSRACWCCPTWSRRSRLLRRKFEAVAHQFEGTPVFRSNVYLAVMESEIASALYALLAQFPELQLGSYPSTERSHDYRTRITLESRDRGYVERALAALLAQVPQGALLRVD
jgi:molybdopterin-biosynthesis enzyme MoeA-like protein